MRLLLSIVLSGLVTACATSEKPQHIYNEIRVENNSRELLRDFSIQVPSTGAEFTCGNIAPLGLCANRFSERPYGHNPIVIQWSYGDGQRQTNEFIVPVPANYAIGVPLQGVVEVSKTGEMQVYFLQDARYN